MDDEDLADAAGAEILHTTEKFTGIGHANGMAPLPDLDSIIGPVSGTMGAVLLGKMGWREGQGIGPRIWRNPRVCANRGSSDLSMSSNLDILPFAPDDIPITSSRQKSNRVGFGGQDQGPCPRNAKNRHTQSLDASTFSPTASFIEKSRKNAQLRGGMRRNPMHHESDSDPDNLGTLGPRLMLAATKTRRKRSHKPRLIPEEPSRVSQGDNPIQLSKVVPGDKSPALAGFILSPPRCLEVNAISTTCRYPYPLVTPKACEPTIQRKDMRSTSPGSSTSQTRKALTPHSHTTRAQILGESQLPGKSVFDFMTPSARESLIAASKKRDVLEANSSSTGRAYPLPYTIPRLDLEVARDALLRCRTGSGPYRDDDAKRARYEQFLAYSCGLLNEPLTIPQGIHEKDFSVELQEFFECAKVFQLTTGPIASRFTISRPSPNPTQVSVLSRDGLASEDVASSAAKLGSFGAITRSHVMFTPAPLLCKRFRVESLRGPRENQVTLKHARQVHAETDRNQSYCSPIGAQDAPVLSLGNGRGLAIKRPTEQVFAAIFESSSE